MWLVVQNDERETKEVKKKENESFLFLCVLRALRG